jgi:DNA-binding response OmpR family regulator
MRQHTLGQHARYLIGPLEIVPDDMLVAVAGRRLWLTRRELELLLVLADQAGRPVSRADIHARIWGTSLAGHKDRSVEVYIRRLRVKLAAAAPE